MARFVSRRGKKNSAAPLKKRVSGTRQPHYRRMWFELLEDRVLLASDLDPALQTVIKTGAAGAAGLFDALHDRIFERVLHRTQPLIANALQVKDTANDQLNSLSSTVQTALGTLTSDPEVTSQEVVNALTGGLGPLLQQTITPQFVNLNPDADFEEVLLPLDLSGKIVERDVPFDLGLPGVLASSGGNVHIVLRYDTDLKLGFSTTTGVFIDTASTDDFQLSFEITTPGLQITGKLGILRFTAMNGPGDPTGLDATFHVNITDGGDADTRLVAAEIGSMGVTSNLAGDATVNLNLVTDLGLAVFPSLTANLKIGWHVNESPDVALSAWGDAPEVSFDNVGLDVGSFFQQLVLPIFEEVDSAIDPVRPILDLLSTPVPILSEIVGRDVTIAELTTTVLPFFTGKQNPNLDMLVAVVEFYDLYQDIQSAGHTGILTLGSFDVGADVRGLSSLTNVNIANPVEAPISAHPGAAEFATRTHAGAYGGGFVVPILEDPTTAFNLLLGRDVEMFRLDFPVLSAGFEVSAFIPIFGFVGVRVAGSLEAGINMGFGYDSSGLRRWSQTNFDPAEEELVLDGFFLRDRVDGVDVPEAYVQARIEATATVDVGIAEAGIGGAIIATVGLNLRDRVNDGRLHFSEIEENIIELGPLCGLFEHTGSLDVALTAYAEVGVGPFSAGVSFDILSVRLVDFTFPCTPGGRPTLAELDPVTHQLTLFTGPLAHRRYELLPEAFRPDEPDFGEVYILKKLSVDDETGLDIIQIEAFGEREIFTGVASIVGDGGAGNDIIQLGQSIDATATLSGGVGNDRLIAGGGGGTVHGDAGDDDIGGYNGYLQLYGDEGNDVIHGGAVGDLMSGGDNDDLLFGNGGGDIMGGGAGIDLLHGGQDIDILSGNEGNDDVRGDDGNDVVFGNDGNDILRGGEGDNTIWGGIGDDFIHALGGVDTIHGEAGIDVVFAGAGIDTVYGGTENDDIHGDEGDDQLFGEAGADLIYGDADNDTIYGGTENDDIHGGTGTDTVYGEDGADQIYGDEDDDELYGNAGVDSIYGGTGRDRVWGGADNDQLFGEDGNDVLYGEQGDDFAGGGTGDDLIDGGIGLDTLFGDAGADRIYGREGDDVLRGHALIGIDDNAADYLYGEAGNDTADGDGGDDYVDGGAGVDALYGGEGADTIVAGIGIGDHLYGGGGDDTITGSDEGSDADPNFNDAVYFGDVIDAGAGDDTVYGLGGADNIFGNSGNDWINSGFGADWIRGGIGNDYLYAGRGFGERIDGEDGNDVIYGSHEGADTLSGGAGRDEIYGQGGNDIISGNADDDHLDGGAGADTVSGDLGNDTLFAGGGLGDQLDGGDGSDMLHGSNDAGETILGGPGRDTIYGQGGNDILSGGADDDIIDGGSGDDTISGDGGSDLLLGGANHDVLYGHSISGAGDDNAVDYVYGDVGTDRNEASTGRDRLFGQGGNDLLWGEGGDDFIDVGTGTSNQFYYGAGESGVPPDFVPPVPTPPPTVQQTVGITHAAVNLPTGVNSAGRWSELAGSGSGDGLSRSLSGALEPSVVVSAVGIAYAAWVDSRHGNYEIYVAKHVPGVGWQEMPGAAGFSTPSGSASEGGLSNTAGSSRRPSIVLDASGNPIVAWTEFSGVNSNIRVSKFDPAANGGSGGWVALGTSLDAAGISGTGKADSPVLMNTSSGPTVAWLDSASATTQVFVKRFSAGSWTGLGGAQFASGTGVSQSASSVSELAATTDSTKVAVAWKQAAAGGSQIFLREFSSGTWNQLGGSATGVGVSNLGGTNRAPAIAYHTGTLYAAWQGDIELRPEIYAKRFTGGAWGQAGGSAQFGVSSTKGWADQPRLVSGGGILHLVWADDARANRTGTSVGIFAKRWNGSDFVAEFALDARTPGIVASRVVESLSATADSSGKPFVSWSEPGSVPQVFLLANTFQRSGVVFTATPANSVQSILDANDLGPGDVIELSNAVLDGFTVSPGDSGVTIVGVPGALITGPIIVAGASDVTLQAISTTGRVTISGGARNAVVGSLLLGGLGLTNTADGQLIRNLVLSDGVELSGTFRAIVQRNTIAATGNGIRFNGTASTDAMIRENDITASQAGISLAVASAGAIRGNDIDGGTAGIDVLSAFTGIIEQNDVHGGPVGVNYAAAAALSRNRIHDNTRGIVSTVANQADALGFVMPAGGGQLQPNDIYANTIGVQLAGVMQSQCIHNNQTGVLGSGSLVAADFDHANLIEANAVGVDFAGHVQFNRISGNTVGIIAHNGQLIAHNLIYRNTDTSIRVNGRTDVRIVSNTMVAPTGDIVRIDGGSREIQLTNNIFWAEAGYDIYVADNSQSGFWSDYNLLHASGSGKLVHWSGYDFTDILDWQEDVATFDLHSRGRTVVNPGWSEPRFFDSGLDDFRTSDLIAGLRFSNPGIDAGDPLTDLALTSSPPNLLADGGFESGLTGWNTNATAATPSAAPIAFEGGNYFTAGAAIAGFAEQSIDLLAVGLTAAQLDSQNFVAVFGGRIRSAAETPPDLGQITLRFLNAANGLISETTVTARNAADRWELVGDRVAVPVGARLIVFRFDSVRSSGTTADSFLDGAFVRVHTDHVAPDVGAYGNTGLDSPIGASTSTLPPHIALRFPDLYADWERDVPHTIRWETYGNASNLPVRIDLYEDGPHGPTLVTNITAATTDDGEFIWIPASSGIDFGTHDLRIQVQLVGDSIAVDRGTEMFSVPENTTKFYVNDRDGSASPGDNRNTGKLASAPKPYPNNVVRIYSLGPTHTLIVDQGDYPIFNPLVIANVAGIGDDEGFVMTGPTTPGQAATLHHANPAVAPAPIIELNDADFVTLEHLALDGGTYGLLVRNGSTNFVGTYLSAAHASLDGVRVESSAVGSRLDHITATANGRYGISVEGPIDQIFDSDVGFNQSTGIHLSSGISFPTTTKLEGNKIHDNRGSGVVSNLSWNSVIGNADLAAGRGNIIRDNAGSGIHTFNNASVLIVGNTVSGHRVGGSAGISTSGTVSQNVVFGNYAGIDVGGVSPVSNNRVYNNTTWGIRGYNVIGNVVYSNGNVANPEQGNGIEVFGVGASLSNNIVYANTGHGIRLRAAASLVNNTVYQVAGNAVQIESQVTGVQLRNNILWVTAGFGIFVPANAQAGFSSDYNLLYATDDGQIGNWQGAARGTLAAWRNATFGDLNSLSQNPLFVDFVDFHEQSLYGSFHGAALAPMWSVVSGLPEMPAGTLTPDGSQSPAIDRGRAIDPYSNEVNPNGGFVNLGAYGNTALASLSPAQYVLVTLPDGGEIWPVGQNFPVRWRSHDFTGNVRIELLDANNAATLVIADPTPNDGEFVWAIPPAITPGSYRVRVMRLDVGAQADTSNNLFTIPEPVSIYYVNDGTVEAGDWTTATGNDVNDGLSTATPKASIRALLEAYDFGPGDTIRVDAGTYNLTANILITPDDSGITIEGFHTEVLDSGADPFADDRGLRSVINRGNTAGGAYAFQFTGADDVTISHLGITGGEWGVVALIGADSDRIIVQSNEIYGNRTGGVSTDSSNDGGRILGNRVFANGESGTGIQLLSTSGALVSNNSVYDMLFGNGIIVRSLFNAPDANSVTNNNVYYTTYGISATGNTGNGTITVSGNNVHNSRFAGINAGAFVQVVGNTVHHNPSVGIIAASALNNTVYDNFTGIDIGTGVAQGNRVYNNSVVGIITSGGTVQSNHIYSNNVGVRLADAGRVVNNQIIDNYNDGIWVWRGSFGRIENNTIYQSGGGDAIQIGDPHPEHFITTFAADRLSIVNNILRTDQSYAMNFAADSGVGSTIDYNNLQITGTGKLGRWQNRDFTDLADWFYELGFDQHSQTADPQLVNPAGADGVLGYDKTAIGPARIIDNGDAGFSVSGSDAWDWAVQASGAGGDFLENAISGANATWRFNGTAAYPPASNLFVDAPVTATYAHHHGLGTATYSHATSASYTVTYVNGVVHNTANFSGTIATIDQSVEGNSSGNVGMLHLPFFNHYTQRGFLSVSDITFTTTLRVVSAGNIIADSAYVWGMTVDDGDENFFSEEGFNWLSAGLDGDYHVRSATSRGSASWQFTGLTPGAYYDVAAFWTSLPDNARSANFTVFDGDEAVFWSVKDLITTPSDFTDAGGGKWSRLGVVKITGDRLVVKLDGAGKLHADAIRIQQVVGDRSADDDFHIAPTSPTIDAGNPASPYTNEPASNGGRINVGHTGNTAEAPTSAAQFVQVLSPNGLEKFEQNQPISIQWRTAGLPTAFDPDTLLSDSPLLYYRLDELSGAVATDSSGSGLHGTYTGGVTLGQPGGILDQQNAAALFNGSTGYIAVPTSSAINTLQLTLEAWVNPDPAITNYSMVAMKTTGGSWNDGFGMHWFNGKLRFFVNNYAGTNTFVEATVATGQWSHIAATYDGTALKLYVNGVLAGTTAYSLPINHSAQPLFVAQAPGGFRWRGMLDEVAIYGTALSAAQIASHTMRADTGTARIELVPDGESEPLLIVAGTPNDGQFTWTIPASISEGSYFLRVTGEQGIQPNDLSDTPFLIVNSGVHYYVNDGLTAGDVFTSVVGSNANSGKSPDAPMASIGALLAAHDLDAGDVIHVDAGTYNLVKNIVISSEDSGVRIEGPGAIGSASVATLNRGSTVVGSYVIQLTGADDVTLDYLRITGGEYGIVALDSTDSDRLVIASSEIYDNSKLGVFLGILNDDSRIESNRFYNNRQGGVNATFASGTIVRDNELFNNNIPGFGGTGITVISGFVGNKSIVSGNEIYGNDLGINVSGTTLIEVTDNVVRNNFAGIRALNNVIVSQNEAYANQGYHGSIGYGISASSSTILDNVIYNNDRGIDAGLATIRDNRIYHNRDTGIQSGGSSLIVGNTIYGHNLGIRMQGGGDAILNNLLYDNSNDGIWVWFVNGGRIENNTIYQSTTGDAIQVGGPHPDQFVTTFPASNVTIRNNILRVAEGYAINVAADSEIGFASDYNNFVIAGSGKLGRWEDRDFTSRQDWFFELGFDGHSIVANPLFIDIDGPDNILGYNTATNTDHGLDDNFRVGDTSPTIDAGDPASAYAAEPGSNGRRVNIGHTGNTAEAPTSATQIVQVLSPNGLEKLERGQPTNIEWRTAGIFGPADHYPGPILADTPYAYYRLADASGTTAADNSGNSRNASYIGGVQLALEGALASDANKSVRLDGASGYVQLPAGFANFTGGFSAEMWAFPTAVGNWQRLFDLGNGAASDNIGLARVGTSNDLQFFVLSGGSTVGAVTAVGALELNKWQHFAVTLSATGAVTIYKNGEPIATGTSGLPRNIARNSNFLGKSNWSTDALFNGGLDEAAFYDRALSAQAIRDHYDRRDYGDVTIELEIVATGLRQTIATAAPNTGRYQWTIPADLAEGQYRIRVSANQGFHPSDASDTSFLVANGGQHYYVNDNAGALDQFTIALGDNFASGKSPSQPMASLRALLAAYDLDPGDVIHVDAGTYRLYRNVLLAAEDSGVLIEGPGATLQGEALGAAATLNRGNSTLSQFVVEMAGADDVTLDHLGFTGGNIGVYAPDFVQSDRLAVSNSDLFSNSGTNAYGIFIGTDNKDARIIGNRAYNNVTGIGSSVGIYTQAVRALIAENESYGQGVGIYTYSTGSNLPANRAVIRDNIVRDNTSIGIRSYQNDLVTGNQVFGQIAANAVGIDPFGSDVVDNTVYNNNVGITTPFSFVSPIRNNSVFKNNIGISARGFSPIVGNQVYSNAVGIQGDNSQNTISNNVVYANTNQGILIQNSSFNTSLINNTVYQSVGDAIRVQGNSVNIKLRNNVVWIDSGYAVFVNANSQTGFTSDYNLLHQSADLNAHLGFWGGVTRDSLTDWQAANSQDAASLAADPLFVDRDGSDNVLGYRASDGYDGGRDDNLLLRAGSPAIDRGDGVSAPTNDLNGSGRFDDPGTPNLGTPVALPYVDFGAYEFQGSSLDVTPPVLVGTTPEGVHAESLLPPVNVITLNFSEPLNPIDAQALANYELRGAGTNGIFGDTDDVVYLLAPAYTSGSSSVALDIGSGILPVGDFRLTVASSAAGGLRDLAGIVLDGDNNSTAGGNYVREFTVGTLLGDYDRNGVVDQNDRVFWKSNFNATSGVGLQADGNGNGIVDAADYSLWQDNLGASFALGAFLPTYGASGSSAAIEAADDGATSASLAPVSVSAFDVANEPIADARARSIAARPHAIDSHANARSGQLGSRPSGTPVGRRARLFASQLSRVLESDSQRSNLLRLTAMEAALDESYGFGDQNGRYADGPTRESAHETFLEQAETLKAGLNSKEARWVDVIDEVFSRPRRR